MTIIGLPKENAQPFYGIGLAIEQKARAAIASICRKFFLNFAAGGPAHRAAYVRISPKTPRFSRRTPAFAECEGTGMAGVFATGRKGALTIRRK
jgi:hypothetical protein